MMEQVKAVIKSPLRTSENHAEEGLGSPAPNAAYFFPSFPSPPRNTDLQPLEHWQQKGLQFSIVSGKPSSCDSHGLPFASDAGIDRTGGGEMAEARARERKIRQLQKGKLGVRVLREDCFKIGDEDSSWVEPDTSRSDYDISIPPFTRLISATRDFLNSRDEEFQFTRSKRLMDSVRNSFGLRGDFSGQHCKGSGEHGTLYQPPSSLQSRKRKNKVSQKSLADDPTATEEVCPLLRDPVTSVRGFMALVRRDAEAGWDIAPALKLARITSAFISFLHHYDVVSEKSTAFAEAAQLGRTALRLLTEAKTFEDILGNGGNLNRALWAVYGGEWKGPERGGLELEPTVEPLDSTEETGSDGGWKVERMPDLRPPAPQIEDARATLKVLLQPLDPTGIRMLGYVPFSRRKISAIFPPTPTSSVDEPCFMHNLHRLATVAAPWTIQERWRAQIDNGDSDIEDDDRVGEGSDGEGFELEKEDATIPEPEVIDLWFEADQFPGDPQTLIGAGIRGRWALMGVKGGPQWWTCKAKDFVLPAFWQSS